LGASPITAGGSEADQIAHDHDPAVDPDADVERARRPGRRVEARDGVDDGQRRPDRPLGIRLVRLRVAEIDQDAVAGMTGDESVEAGHQAGDMRMEGGDDLPQVLGVQPLADRGRADEVHHHHAQKPPVGQGCRLLGASRRRHRAARGAAFTTIALVGCVLGPARTAGPGQRRAAIAAKLLVGADRGTAAGTDHPAVPIRFRGL
jgi:hypothetical protein